MIALLLAALTQDLKVEVLQKSPEVRLVVRGPKEWAADVAMIRQRTLEAREGRLEENWAEVSAELPPSERNATTAEITLNGPGLYQIVLGAGSVQVAVSRAEMQDWKNQLKSLRDAARRLELIATEIDQVKDPSPDQIARIRLRLQQERARMSKIGTELKASAKALEVAVDRLYYSRILSRLPSPPEGEALPGYGPAHKDKAGQESEVQKAAKALKDVIAREGALVIADELRLLLASDENPPGSLRILRWRDRAKALAVLRDAREALGEFPELERLLKEAQESRNSEELLIGLQGVREKICKP